jgi:hypothetical protein
MGHGCQRSDRGGSGADPAELLVACLALLVVAVSGESVDADPLRDTLRSRREPLEVAMVRGLNRVRRPASFGESKSFGELGSIG